MIQLLLFLFALVLLACGYYLWKKSEPLFLVIEKTEKNRQFLACFGKIYCFLGVCMLPLVLFYQKTLVFLAILLVLLVAAVFSVQLAKKVHSR